MDMSFHRSGERVAAGFCSRRRLLHAATAMVQHRTPRCALPVDRERAGLASG